MTYLSYLHMEKTYKIPTENLPEPNVIIVNNNQNDHSSVRSGTQRVMQANNDGDWNASIIGSSRMGSVSSFFIEPCSNPLPGVTPLNIISQQIDSRNSSLDRESQRHVRLPSNTKKDSPRVKKRLKRESHV